MQPKHNCPNHCHKCPDMDGNIMPMCMGQAVWGDDDKITHCTCYKPGTLSRIEIVESDIKELKELLKKMRENNT